MRFPLFKAAYWPRLLAAALVLLTVALAGGDVARAQPRITPSQLPSASCPGDGTEILVGNQDGATRKFGPSWFGCNGNTLVGEITRAQIATTTIGANKTVRVSGRLAVGDYGLGEVFSSVGATSTGWDAIRDAGGTWFNLVSADSNAGYFGLKGDDGASLITSLDVSNNPQWRGTYAAGESWDYVAMQEAIYYALAGASTPGSIVWNSSPSANYGLNRKLVIPSVGKSGGAAKYGINHQLLMVGTKVSIEFANNAACLDWQGAYNVSMLLTDSVSYGRISKPCLVTSQVTTPPGGGEAPLWQIDYDGAHTGLASQQLEIDDAFINPGGFNNAGIAINPVGGSAAQGSTIIFNNPEFVGGVVTDYCLWVNGANALGIQVNGGDMQSCNHDSIRNTNGSIFYHGTTFENQPTSAAFTPFLSQINQNGADFHSTGAFGGFSAENRGTDIRSEGDVGMVCDAGATCFAHDIQVVGVGLNNWFAGYPYQAGMMSEVAVNGVNHGIMVVDDGGNSGGSSGGWRLTTSGSTATVIQDSGASYTTNQWAGYDLSFRFSNGATFQAVIVSNTATSITLSGAGLGFAPPTGAGTGLYHINGLSSGSTPTWSSLPTGRYIQTLGGSPGYGFSTTAGSTTIGLDNNSAGFLAVNDYVVIPGADEICNIGECIAFPLYAKVVSINIGALTAVVSKAAVLTVAREPGYSGTPFTDNQIKWIDVPYPAFFGVTSCKDSFAAQGLFYQVANMDNCGGSWADWNQGPSGVEPGVVGIQQDYFPRQRTISPVSGGLAGGTVSLAPNVLLGNDATGTLGANTTVTAPTGAGYIPALMTRDLTLIVGSLGGGQVLTFGTGFNASTPAWTASVAGDFVFRFEYSPVTGQWDEVSGPNHPSPSVGASGQILYNNAGAEGGFTMAGDCTITVPNITCLKTNGTNFGTFATQNYATPPVIGGTTPNAGSFTTVAVTTNGSAAAPSLPIGAGAATTGFYSDGTNIFCTVAGVQVCEQVAGGPQWTRSGGAIIALFKRLDATLANSSTMGQIEGQGENSTGAANIIWGDVVLACRVCTTGSEESEWLFKNRYGGVETTDFTMDGGFLYGGIFASNNRIADVNGNLYDTVVAAHNVVLSEGTTPFSAAPPGAAGQSLFSQGSSADPAFEPWSQDCTVTSAGVVTCLKTNNVAFGTFATANAATPPAIGGTTPAAGSFSSVTDTGLSATAQAVCNSTGKVLTNCAPGSGQSANANPTAPASTSAFKMQGLAGAITPTKGGNLLITIDGTIASSTVTAGDGIQFEVSYGTGGAPSNAGALAGTQCGPVEKYMNPTTVTAADVAVPFSVSCVVTGQTNGTALWLDLAAESVGTVSSGTLKNVEVSAIEF